MHLTCCVALQVYCPEPERGRIDVFDLLSDGGRIVHVGCRPGSGQKQK